MQGWQIPWLFLTVTLFLFLVYKVMKRVDTYNHQIYAHTVASLMVSYTHGKVLSVYP